MLNHIGTNLGAILCYCRISDPVIQNSMLYQNYWGETAQSLGWKQKIRNRWSYALFSRFAREISYLYLSALKNTKISLLWHSVPCAMAHWRLRAEWSVELSMLWMRSVRARRSERLLRSSRACLPRIGIYRPISSRGKGAYVGASQTGCSGGGGGWHVQIAQIFWILTPITSVYL